MHHASIENDEREWWLSFDHLYTRIFVFFIFFFFPVRSKSKFIPISISIKGSTDQKPTSLIFQHLENFCSNRPQWLVSLFISLKKKEQKKKNLIFILFSFLFIFLIEIEYEYTWRTR